MFNTLPIHLITYCLSTSNLLTCYYTEFSGPRVPQRHLEPRLWRNPPVATHCLECVGSSALSPSYPSFPSSYSPSPSIYFSIAFLCFLGHACDFAVRCPPSVFVPMCTTENLPLCWSSCSPTTTPTKGMRGPHVRKKISGVCGRHKRFIGRVSPFGPLLPWVFLFKCQSTYPSYKALIGVACG